MPAAACQRLDQQWPEQRKPGPRSHHSCRDFNKGEQGGFCVLLGGIQRVALGSYRVPRSSSVSLSLLEESVQLGLAH